MVITITSGHRLWYSSVEPFYKQRIGFQITGYWSAACSVTSAAISHFTLVGERGQYTSSLQALYAVVHIKEWTWITKCWLSSIVRQKFSCQRNDNCWRQCRHKWSTVDTSDPHVSRWQINSRHQWPPWYKVKGFTVDAIDHQGTQKRAHSRQLWLPWSKEVGPHSHKWLPSYKVPHKTVNRTMLPVRWSTTETNDHCAQ